MSWSSLDGDQADAPEPDRTREAVPEPARRVRSRRRDGAARSRPRRRSTAPRSRPISWTPASPASRTASGSRALAGAQARGSRGRAESSWKACTTPSSSSRCGATTCASRASWSSASTAPTTSSRPSRSWHLARSVASACCSTTSSPGARRPGSRQRSRGPHVLVTGTPYVDVWQAVRPAVVGIDRWPDVPMGTDWKAGAERGARARRPARGVAPHPRLGDVVEGPRAAARRSGRSPHRLRDRGVRVVRLPTERRPAPRSHASASR